MAERLSTGFVDAVNQDGSVKSVMQDGIIAIFAGLQPASADDAETGTLLALITVDGAAFTPGSPEAGLEMGSSVDGVLSKAAAESWEGLGTAEAGATGTVAGWCRWYDNDYVQGASTTAIRIDGRVGNTSSYELQLGNTTIAENAPVIISSFTYTPAKS